VGMIGDLWVLSSQCLAMFTVLASREVMHASRNSGGISKEVTGRKSGNREGEYDKVVKKLKGLTCYLREPPIEGRLMPLLLWDSQTPANTSHQPAPAEGIRGPKTGATVR
jgi:hypothetical protein